MKRRNIKIRELNMGPGTRILTSKIARRSKKMFATGDNKNKITVWLLDDDEPVRTLSSGGSAQSEISALCYTNSENELVSGSSRGIINLWDMESSKVSTTLKGHSASLTALSTFSYEDFRLASGSYDTNIKLWDLRTKNNTATLKHHTEQISSIDTSPDSKLLISGSTDSTVKLWDLRYPQKIMFTYTDHTGPVNAVKFNPEDIMFASGSSDKTAKYFRCEPGYYNFISSTEMGTNQITAIEFSEDGRILYTAANDSLKLWNMGKHGLLLETVESPWKGVQDLCLIDMTLTGIAWSPAGLSVWAYTSRPYTRDKRPQKQKVDEQEKLVLPSLNPPQIPSQNRLQQLKHVSNQINQIQDRIRNIQQVRMVKQQSKEQKKEEPDSFEVEISSNRSQQSQGQIKKRNFIQQVQRRREDEARRKIQQQKQIADQERMRAQDNKRQADEEKKRKADAERKKEQDKKKAQEEAKRRAQDEKDRRQRERRENQQMEARRIVEQREQRDLQIQRFNENMAKQQQGKYSEANHLLESILEQEKMDGSLNISAFMGDQLHKQKFKQYDLISDILRDDSKFTAVLSVRKNLLGPILKWWGENNIKNALYAINEAEISVVVDALQAIVTAPKFKSNITPDVAIPLVRKSAELMLNKHYRYVRNGIFNINQIVLMYKDQLIKLKTFNPGGKLDFSREERMAKYDRLIDEFLNVFRMERLKKYSKEDQTQELNQLALELYKNLEEILRKCVPRNGGQMVPG